MSDVTVTFPGVQVSASRLWSFICWPFRRLAGTAPLCQRINTLQAHVEAITGLVLLIVAETIVSWPSDKREKALALIANFRLVDRGLASIGPPGNPLTAEEAARLHIYNEWAQRGQRFSPEEASDFRVLSERVAREYAGQDWVTELLKVALFIFALYVLAKVLEPES